MNRFRVRLGNRAGSKFKVGLLSGGVCLGFALIEVVLGQTQNATPISESVRKFEHHAEIASVYDKSKDETRVAMDWYRVYAGLLDPNRVDWQVRDLDVLDNRLDIQASFVFPGRVLSSTPETVEFGVRLGNRGGSIFKVGETPEFTAAVDGEAISLGHARVVKARTIVTSENTRQVSFAQLQVRFTYQGLLRVVRAKKVSMTIGKTRFDLPEANLEALRDFANRMLP